MPTLLEKQMTFASLVPSLINKARSLGFGVKLGECWRPKEMAEIYARRGTGIRNSAHSSYLAIDLLLLKNRVYLTASKDYEALGVYWESLSTPGYTCCWGGRFKRADGNHFSIEHNGVR